MTDGGVLCYLGVSQGLCHVECCKNMLPSNSVFVTHLLGGMDTVQLQ